MSEWSEQYRDPRWQRKRLEAMEAAEWKCQRCWDSEMTLNVHHKRYVKGRKVWEYTVPELAVLCEPCHSETHAELDVIKALLAGTTVSLDTVAGLIAGYLDANNFLHHPLGVEVPLDGFELGVTAACLEWMSAVDGKVAWRKIIIQAAETSPTAAAVQKLVQGWKGDPAE